MKVLSFLEFYILPFDDKKELFLKLKLWTSDYTLTKFEGYSEKDIINILNIDYHKFTSKPFKPEIITELFEGINVDERDENPYDPDVTEPQMVDVYEINYKTEITFNQKEPSKFGYTICYDYDNYQLYPYPRTLDDFINDCQRAGIELNWKVNK
jgi:hypothetical protein